MRVGGAIRQPTKTRHVNPIYPASAQSAGIEAVVILACRIGVDGKLADVRTLREGHPDLAAAATDAVWQWEFTPTLLDGLAVEVTMTVTIQFSLP